MKVQLPASLLLAATHAAGHGHTMSDEGMNVSISLEQQDDSLFESDATYAVAVSKEHQTLTVTTIGANTFASAVVPAAVEIDGSFCFNPKKLGLTNLLRSFGGDSVRLMVINDTLLNIYCGAIAAEANFAGLGRPITLAPQDMGKTSCEISIPTDVFLPSIQSVLLSVMPPNGASRILKGVHIFDGDGGTVSAATTDTKRITRINLDITHQSGKLPGLTISTKVLEAYKSAVLKLIPKDEIQSSVTTLTVGESDRFFLCAEAGKVKLCLQYVGLYGQFPAPVKNVLSKGEPNLKIGGCSVKALLTAFKPLAVWAKAAQEKMCVFQAEPSQLRIAFRNGSGFLMHLALPATSNTKQPVCFAVDVNYIEQLVDAIKEAGDAPLTFHVWMPSSGAPRIIVRLPKTNPGYTHMLAGLTPPSTVNVYDWFKVPAPLYERPEEKATAKKGGAKPAAAATPAAAAKPGTVAKKGGAKPAAAATPAAAAKPGTVAKKGATKPAAVATPAATPAAAQTGTAAKKGATKPAAAATPAATPAAAQTGTAAKKGATKPAAVATPADTTPPIPGL